MAHLGVDPARATSTRTFQVKEGAFAGEVPAGADGDRIRFNYLNAQGEQIATKTVTVGIESQ